MAVPKLYHNNTINILSLHILHLYTYRTNDVYISYVDLDIGPHPGLHREHVDLSEPLSITAAPDHVETVVLGVEYSRVSHAFCDIWLTV